MEQTGLTIWLTGRPGSGKTTLARGVGAELTRRGRRVELLDGDEIRRTFSPELGFSREHRDINIKRIGYLANVLSRNGVIAIVAAISPYESARAVVRQIHQGRFLEIYVECALPELIRRDPKGLYARALSGSLDQFTGVSDPYEIPTEPDLIIGTDQESVAVSTAKLLAFLESRGVVAPSVTQATGVTDEQPRAPDRRRVS